MNNALRNSIARPSLRAAVNSQDLVIDSGAATSLRPVQPGHCLSFDGVNDYISIGGVSDYTFFNVTGVFTFGAWVKLTDHTADDAFIIVGNNGTASSATGVALLYENRVSQGSPKKLRFLLGKGTGGGIYISSAASSDDIITDNLWHYVTVTGDGSAVTFYVDGVADVTASYTSALGGTNSSYSMQLGATNSILPLDGNMSGVFISDAEASAAQVLGLFNGVTPFTSYRQYNLSESTGTVAIDSSGNGGNGTLVNGPTWTTDNSLPYSWLNQVGYTDVSGLLTPRDESDTTKDTDGNALEWSGSAFPRRPEYRGNNTVTWNGTTQYLSAAHLAGIETVVSSVGTSTPSISAGRIDFTAGTCGNVILSDGTVYTGAEGSGATWHDISGSGDDGTLVNGPTWATVDGEANAHNINNGFSRRMLFDGVNDDITIANDATLNPTTALSVSAWVVWDGTSGTIANQFDWIVCKNNSSNATQGYYLGLNAGDGRVRFNVSGNRASISYTNFNKGQLYHLCGTAEASGNVKFYVDGVLVDTSSTTLPSSFVTYSGALNVGRTPYYASPRFDGLIYNVAIFNETLSDAEVATLYSGGEVTSGLVSSYTGNGNTDTDWLDTVGSNDGTVVGSPALLRVPADSAAPTLDVYGDRLTNPAVANSHNDAETTWDFENIGTGDTIAPETSHLSNFDAVTFSDTNYSLGTTSPIDSVFWRDKSGVLKDRATGYGATLTGAGLVYANNYTDGERWNNLAPWDDDNIWND